jgi:acyl-CoA hydrolase
MCGLSCLFDIMIETRCKPMQLAEIGAIDIERAIAARVRDFVPDSATLQAGIGEVSVALSDSLTDSPLVTTASIARCSPRA